MPIAAPYDDVFDAIQAYLGYTDDTGTWIPGDWDTSLAPLVYENDGDGAPAGEPAPWVLIVLDTNLYSQQTIGAAVNTDSGGNRWDEDGTIWFHVFTPRGSGSREARRIGKALANMFRGKLLLGEELEFMDADMGAGDPGQENGNYYLLSVSLEWRRTEAQ